MRWPTCLAAAPARWAATRRFAIACGWKTCRARPSGSARFSAAALRAVRVGGRVIYSTCSLEPEENEQVVAAVLAEVANARQVSLRSEHRALLDEGVLTSSGAERLRSCLTPEGALRLLPGVFHTDGFFIALIEKTA